jgi:hypothetical protein
LEQERMSKGRAISFIDDQVDSPAYTSEQRTVADAMKGILNLKLTIDMF